MTHAHAQKLEAGTALVPDTFLPTMLEAAGLWPHETLVGLTVRVVFDQDLTSMTAIPPDDEDLEIVSVSDITKEGDVYYVIFEAMIEDITLSYHPDGKTSWSQAIGGYELECTLTIVP